MIASYELGFCSIEVFTDYTVGVIHEGKTTLPEYMKDFQKIIDIHYNDKPFVYISNRLNSFSIDPAIYIEASKISNLIGFAVVSNHPLQKMQVKIEKAFFDKEFRQFDTLKDALAWKDEIINTHFH